jgi:hypothetical protein
MSEKKGYPKVGEIWQYYDHVPALIISIDFSKEFNSDVATLMYLGNNPWSGKPMRNGTQPITTMREIEAWKRLA